MNTPVSYLPIIIQLVVALGFVVTTMIATHLIGPKRNSKKKDDSFECGIEGVGNARVPFSIKYFMTAILFVLFDVEVVFFYPYAVNFKEMGLEGFIAVSIFIAFFLIGFAYVYKRGALEWDK